MTIQQFLLILRARIWLVVLITIAAMALALGVSLMLEKQYTAEASVLVDVKGSEPLPGSGVPVQFLPGYMATQIDIINSERVARRVVERLKLDQSAVAREQWLADTEGAGDIRVWLADLLKRKLEVRPSRDSTVVHIGFTGTDPAFAAVVANAFAASYIDVNLELKVEPARQYAQWFDERTASLREKLEVAQSKLSAFQRENGIVATDERLDVENARLAELSSQLVAVQAQRVDSHSRQAQTGSAETLPEVMQNGLIQGLKAELARQEATRQQLAGRLGRNHPELARADAEIASLRDRIAAEVRRVASSIGTTSRVNDRRESEIRASLDAQKQRVLELKGQRDQIAVLQRDVENAQRTYDMVTQRLAQTSLESQNQQTNVVVLTPAVAPIEHSRPRTLLNAIVATFLGLLVGISSALLRELADQRVRGVADLADTLDMPVLGVIPARAGRNARLAA